MAGLIYFIPTPALTQSMTPSDSLLQQRLEEIDQKERILERKWELAQEDATAKSKQTAVAAAGKDGFNLKSADGNFQLKLRGYIQSDARFFGADDQDSYPNTFLMRRIRPIFEGTLDKHFDFYLMMDFGGGSATVQDAYIDFHYVPQMRLRFGKMKGPIGIERLQSGANLLFMERSLPTNLVPNRDLGIQLHGELAQGAITYAVGLFNGVVDGASADTDVEDGKDIMARLFLLPFKNNDGWLQNFGFGLARSSGIQNGTVSAPALTSYKTPAQLTAFRYRSDGTAAGTVIANGKRTRMSPQAYFYNGPFGILAEYVISEQVVKLDAANRKLGNSSWQVAASYMLTGQKLTFKGAALSNSFNPKENSWGAFELAARLSNLSVDENSFPLFADNAKSIQEINSIGVGINWYLNKNIKFSLNYEQSTFDRGAAKEADRVQEKVISSRLQLSY